jgi:signal transduction histidine kinase
MEEQDAMSTMTIDRAGARDSLFLDPARAPSLRAFALRCVTDGERQRLELSRVLHDELGQTMARLNMDLYALSRACRNNRRVTDRLINMRKAVGCMAQTVRKLAADFRPTDSATSDLQDLIDGLIERFQIESGLPCNHELHCRNHRVEHSLAIAIHHILFQTLIRVADEGATRLSINASVDNGAVAITVHASRTRVRETGGRARLTMDRWDPIEWIHALQGEIRIDRSVDLAENQIVHMVLPLHERGARI